MSAIGTKRTSPSALHMSAFDPKRTFIAPYFMALMTEIDGQAIETARRFVRRAAIWSPHQFTAKQ